MNNIADEAYGQSTYIDDRMQIMFGKLVWLGLDD